MKPQALAAFLLLYLVVLMGTCCSAQGEEKSTLGIARCAAGKRRV